MRTSRCAHGVRAAVRRLIIGWVYPDTTSNLRHQLSWACPQLNPFQVLADTLYITDQYANAQRGERLHMGLTMDKYDLTNNDSMLLSQLMQRILDDKRCTLGYEINYNIREYNILV